MNSDDPTTDDVEAALRGLEPAASRLDVSTVFYQAGYQAAVAGQKSASGGSIVPFVLGVAVAAVIIAPISYQAGTSGNEIVARQPPPAETIARTPLRTADAAPKTAKEEPAVNSENPSDPFDPPSHFYELLGGSWFPIDGDDASQATTLTASHLSLNSHDVGQVWPELSIGEENRYQTFATKPGTTERPKTLAISDTIELAKKFGDF